MRFVLIMAMAAAFIFACKPKEGVMVLEGGYEFGGESSSPPEPTEIRENSQQGTIYFSLADDGAAPKPKTSTWSGWEKGKDGMLHGSRTYSDGTKTTHTAQKASNGWNIKGYRGDDMIYDKAFLQNKEMPVGSTTVPQGWTAVNVHKKGLGYTMENFGDIAQNNAIFSYNKGKDYIQYKKGDDGYMFNKWGGGNGFQVNETNFNAMQKHLTSSTGSMPKGFKPSSNPWQNFLSANDYYNQNVLTSGTGFMNEVRNGGYGTGSMYEDANMYSSSGIFDYNNGMFGYNDNQYGFVQGQNYAIGKNQLNTFNGHFFPPNGGYMPIFQGVN